MLLWESVWAILFFQLEVIGVENKIDLNLTLLHVFFRHGDKVPHRAHENYPNDPNANFSYFPAADGELTNAGKLLMYELGKKLRKSYGGFLGDYYNPNIIFGRATDVPRTQMSMQLVLAGLFPPVQEQIWTPTLLWQPVFYYHQPNAEDVLLSPTKCSKNMNAAKESARSDAIQNILKKHLDDIRYISKHSGKQIRSLFDILLLYDLFNEQRAYNLTLPEWTKKVYPKAMRAMAIKSLNLRSYTVPLRRYNGGFLLHEITKNIKAHSEGTLEPSERKAFLYSIHEYNIVSMARTLGLAYPIYPKFGSAFIIETLQDKYKRFYIKVIFWTGVKNIIISRSLPNCEDPCPFDRFLKFYGNVIPTTEEVEECELEICLNKVESTF